MIKRKIHDAEAQISQLEMQAEGWKREAARLKAELERIQNDPAFVEYKRLKAENEQLKEALEFVERWAVYKRYKPDGKSVTAEEAINVIAFHPAIREITKRFEASGEIDLAAYARDRAEMAGDET